jgi:RND family efflux transporter MFP subunit
MLSGKVTAVNFNVGDEVKEGDVLFETDSESAVRALEQAKNGYELVRISGEQAKLGLEQAKVNYELSIQNIDSAVSGSASALSDLNYEKQLTMALQAYNSAESQLNIISGDRIDTSHFNEIRRELREAEKALAANEEGSWERYRDAWDDYNYFADDYADYQGYLTALDNAYENLELVRESYEIYKGIQNDEKLSSSELQRKLAELSYQSAQKSAGISDINLSNALKTVEAAQSALDYTRVTAPISGVVTSKNVKLHEMAAAGTPAYVVASPQTVNVTFSVSSKIALGLSLGDRVTVLANQKSYAGKITEIGQTANTATGLFTVKAQLSGDTADLRSGVPAKVTADTARAENALLVPLSAVYYEDGKAYVYVNRDGTAVKTYIETGVLSIDAAQVLSGLDGSEQIVTSWNARLIDGVRITAAKED